MNMKSLGVLCVLLFSLVVFCSTSFGATLYYATNGRNAPSNLYSIDTENISPQFNFGTIDALIRGLSSSGIPNTMYAADIANQRLLEIEIFENTDTMVVSPVGLFGADIRGLAYDPGTGVLYGRDGSQSLYTIDTLTGVASQIYNMGISFNGMSFDNSGTLYGVSSTDDLYTIDPTGTDPTPNIIGPNNVNQISGIYVDPDTGTMYGVQRNDADAFHSIDQGSGAATGLFPLLGTNARALAAPLPPAPPAQPIPTMSEWGMIVMSLLVAGYAVMALRKRQAVS